MHSLRCPGLGVVPIDGVPLSTEGRCCIVPLEAWGTIWVSVTELGIMSKKVLVEAEVRLTYR